MKNSTKKDDTVQGLFYKNFYGKTDKELSPPMEIKKISVTGNLVYGVELDEVERDDKFTDIPKFVVECIKIIEMEENIRTNGIYRASGKKDSIDKLRKKVSWVNCRSKNLSPKASTQKQLENRFRRVSH